MKRILKFLTISLLTFSANGLFAQTQKDTAAVVNAINDVSQYFVNGDMKAFGNIFDKDATFINVIGLVASGREEIVDMHRKWEIDTTTSTLKNKIPIVRFIDKNTAYAFCGWGGLVFKGNKGEKQPIQSGFMTYILQRQKKEWKILSATNAYNFFFPEGKDFDLIPYKDFEWGN